MTCLPGSSRLVSCGGTEEEEEENVMRLVVLLGLLVVEQCCTTTSPRLYNTHRASVYINDTVP